VFHNRIRQNASNSFIFLLFKKIQMGNLLYIIAVVMIIFWAIGFFAYSAGSIIHILLVIAAISILLKLIKGEKVL
jgi:hypothetical protein